MQHIKTFESFVNEKKSFSGPWKDAIDWHWKEIKVIGFESGNSTMLSKPEAENAATALVSYWVDKKPFKSSGFTIASDQLKKLDNMSKVKPFKDTVEITVVDSKTDKEWKYTIILRDTEWGLPAEKSLYAEVGKDFGNMKYDLYKKISGK